MYSKIADWRARRLDRQIDDLVYDLYRLTQAQRRLIEQEVPTV